jgi:hypothetical protein
MCENIVYEGEEEVFVCVGYVGICECYLECVEAIYGVYAGVQVHYVCGGKKHSRGHREGLKDNGEVTSVPNIRGETAGEGVKDVGQVLAHVVSGDISTRTDGAARGWGFVDFN